MGFLAVVVGVVVGFATIAFGYMIAFIYSLAFLGNFLFSYDANVHTQASPWGIFFILVPVIGAFLVIWVVKTFAPDAKGHGVPEGSDRCD